MKLFLKTVATFVFIVTSLYAIGQDKGSVADIIKEGLQLHSTGNYAGAIEKYAEALKIEPENPQANYEMALSLLDSGKGADGIPFAEKAIKGSSSTTFIANSYNLLGSIYDQNKQKDLAIEAYKNGIKIKPDDQQLHYNLGITYSRNKQYPEAEASAIEAIKLDPKHASSLRLYALVAFHQDKRLPALMAFCNFLILEPATPRSAEAYGNIQHILQGGVLKDVNGRTTIIVSRKESQENQVMNYTISLAAVAGKNKKLTGMDLLQFELKTLFDIAGKTSAEKTGKDFFEQFFAGYFYQLAQTNNMPAFTRLVSLSANNEANSKWMADNADAVKELNHWIEATPRSF
jgi:tetratricopeptide (TPR) repeat protein